MLAVWLPLTKDIRNQGLADLTISGTPVFKNSGKLGGKSLDLNTRVSFTCSALANLTTFSIAFWAKVNDDSSLSTDWVDIIGFTDATSSGTTGQLRWETCYSSSNKGRGISSHDNTTYAISNGFGKIFCNKNIWVHLTCTVDLANSSVKEYVNGEHLYTYATNGGHLTGAFWLGQTGVINGEIQDVRIYDHALSQTEVKELSKGLVLHYPLNRGGWGQENLYGYGSDLQTTLSGLNNYNNSFSIIEEEGKKCAHVSGALTTTKYLQSKLTYTPSTMEQFTFSAEVKIKNIVRGTKNPMCEFYFSGVTLDGAWRGFTVEYIKVDGQKVGATAIGFDRYLTDTAWHKVAVTAHFNYNGTSTIPALYPTIYLRDCTGDLYIRNVKLEKGPVATPWCPNSSDTLATTMGLNSTTEYDCSGFCNNGTRVGTFEWTSDTPKYQVSTKFNGSECILRDSPNADIYTLTCWAKTSKSKKTAQFMVADSNSKLSISFYGGNIISYFYGNSAGTGSKCILGTEYKENEWNFFVVVKTGENTRDCYCNGVKLTPTSNDWWSTATGFFIGNRSSGGNGPFYGEICDVRAYATALSADDVKSLYQNCATIDPDGTIRGQIRS